MWVKEFKKVREDESGAEYFEFVGWVWYEIDGEEK